MKPEDAEEYTQSLGQIVHASWRQVALAHRLGVPQALGLTLEEWVKNRLKGYIKLPVLERQEAVKELTAEHSQREIASILGVDQATVSRDANASRHETDKPDEPEFNVSSDANASSSSPDPLEQSKKREDALRAQLALAQQRPKLVNKTYGTIVLDPPWPMKKIERDVRPNQVEFDYPTMDEDALRAFRADFQRMAAEDCHVFMWTTPKFLPMALRLFDEYAVKYILPMVWHKPGGFQPIGLPQYNAEFVLYGRVGAPQFVDTKAFNICFEAPRREHSRKPDEFYDVIRRVTAEPRIDVFSREPREGFAQYGNETLKFAETG